MTYSNKWIESRIAVSARAVRIANHDGSRGLYCLWIQPENSAWAAGTGNARRLRKLATAIRALELGPGLSREP